jgi:FdhE protein
MNNTPDIKQIANMIKNIRSSYGPLMDFYQDVFLAQEQSKRLIDLPLIIIEPDTLKLKQENEMPLIDQSEFLIDFLQADKLLDSICNIAQTHATKLSKAAAVLKIAISNNVISTKKNFLAIINNNDSTIHDNSKVLDIVKSELIFFLSVSISPSIQICAQQLSSYLKEDPIFKKGYCPICGNHPDVSFFNQDGKKFLKCSFCDYEWDIKRMGCVFCESQDSDLQHYFFNKEEKEYRVYLCDNCHNYIKTIDLRKLTRAFYPKLEQIATLHLDMEAQEKGYNNIIGTLKV